MSDVGKASGAETGRKLLHVLLSFTEERPLWTVAELAGHLGLSQSMVYRYVALLREVGLIDNAGGKYLRIAALVHALADAADAAQPPFSDVALPVMEEVRDAIDETVILSRRSGWNAYCVDRVESLNPVRLQFERGQAMSLHSGSMARVLLAGMTKPNRERYLATVDFGEAGPNPKTLSQDALDQVLADGVTESFEEIDAGIWGVAAAITVGNEVVAAIGTAAPMYRTDEDKRREITRHIADAAKTISAALEAGPES